MKLLTHGQTDRQTDKCQVKHDLLGGGSDGLVTTDIKQFVSVFFYYVFNLYSFIDF